MQHQFQYPKVTPVQASPSAGKPQGEPRSEPQASGTRSPKQR